MKPKPTPLAAIHLNDGTHGLPKNPRFIRDERFRALCDSVRDNPEYMPARPIVVDEACVILGGNMRYRACKELKIDPLPEGWVQVVAGWTVEKKRRFIIMDNRPFGADDFEILANEFDIDELLAAGFTDVELGDILGEVDESDEDAEPQVDRADELAELWGVKEGQVWSLGEHRLLCGDSTKPEDVARCLGGVAPLLMVTDPPYGVEYDASWQADAGANNSKLKMGTVENDDIADWTPAWRLFAGDVAYVYHAGVMASTVQASLEACKFKIRSQIIWAKDRMALSRGDYHWQHEPCWYAVRDGKSGHRNKDRTQTTLWTIPARDDAGHGHGTQKPVECMARPIRNHDSEHVYDPFSGSGTTIIACEQLNRKCLAIELSPGYVGVTLQRYLDAMGKTPEKIDG